MSGPSVTEALFDLLDDFVQSVHGREVVPDDYLEEASSVLVFCQSFFDQFFSGLGLTVSGFDKRNKETVVAYLVKRPSESSETLEIATMFEEFCDVYADLASISGGGDGLTHQGFVDDYMNHLLWLIEAWAAAAGFASLEQRTKTAAENYASVLSGAGW